MLDCTLWALCQVAAVVGLGALRPSGSELGQLLSSIEAAHTDTCRKKFGIVEYTRKIAEYSIG